MKGVFSLIKYGDFLFWNFHSNCEGFFKILTNCETVQQKIVFEQSLTDDNVKYVLMSIVEETHLNIVSLTVAYY